MADPGEIRVQDEQGTVHVFPPGSTPEMIAQVMNVKVAAAPAAPINAHPSVWNVLTQPTDKTDAEYGNYRGAAGVAGATIKGLDDVARGTQGAIKGVYDAVRHPIDTAKGIASLPSQAAQVPGAIKDINSSPDPTGTYLNVAQDTASQGAGQALAALGTEGLVRGAPAATGLAKNALPSAARAGASFQEIKNIVGDVPIDTAKVGNSALELYTQSQRGATLPPAVNKLVRRLAAPDSPPMTYAEAKDFQSNISSLSANEKMNLKPNQVRLVGQLNADLKASLADASDTVGKGEQFTKAMKEYHDAMKLKGYSDAAIDAAWKAAIGAAGVYGAAKVFGLATEAPKALRP